MTDASFRKFSPTTQCEGKKRYRTKREAKNAARHAERAIGRTTAYRCPHCGAFHIGHEPAWKQAQRPA